MSAVAVIGSVLIPVSPASAAALPRTTLYFHSAGGGYAQDVQADPSGTQTGAAPAGSTLSTAAPVGSTSATATYHPGAQNSGLPSVPTFSLPAGTSGTATNVCLDLYISNVPNAAFAGGVLSRFARPTTLPGGTPFNNSAYDPGGRVGGDIALRHIRGLVSTTTATNSLAGLVFSVFGYTNSNAELTLHYDSATHPSSITVNADPATCNLGNPGIPGGGSPGIPAPTYDDLVLPEIPATDLRLYNGTADFCGEPTLGVNWNTNAVMMICGPYTYRGVPDATGNLVWEDATLPFPGFASLDPILSVDPITGRVFDSQLLGATSATVYSDDDGRNWNPTQGSGQPHGQDHQTIGAGPMHESVDPSETSTYGRRSVYYCSQGVAAALCAQSRDGGITYDPAVPVYTIDQCGGLHGHVQVGPAGQVYLPNRDCDGRQAIVRSLDGNKTWSLHHIPGGATQAGSSDPGLAVGSGGTLYLGYENADGHPTVTVSRDEGDNWTTPIDVGVPYGIANTQFTTMVAGDDDRAAFAFLGTSTPGNDQAADFPGVWHLFISTTYDRGATWTTVEANPGNVAQRGCVWLGGGDNPCRNLLDFMDVTVDRAGRVLVGWADGCWTAQNVDCTSAAGSTTAQGTVTRQSSGLPLFRSGNALDPTDPDAVVPEVPVGVVLPLLALALLGSAYQVARKRSVV